MARRLHQTLADYVVIAISPALIMLLVGSLMYFLLHLFYQGQYQERLHWVMTCFVFAAVLIARISIEQGFERAAPFGAALALVLGFAAHQFMEYDGSWIDNYSWIVNFTLIGVVWWCVHQLTWDCTVVEDDQDSSGEGLMQIVGLEGTGEQQKRTDEGLRLEGTTSRDVPASYWQRYLQHQRRPHAPGVWVVYFSLAALPIFGVGQWFIPASDVAGRRYAFGLLTVYVTSGLALLLTTSFLGLRRYLRQRKIEMPATMAGLWLSTGGILIVLLVAAAAILPRPSAEYAIAELPFSIGSKKQDVSDFAPVLREGTQDAHPHTRAASDTSQSEEPFHGGGSQPSSEQQGGGSQGSSESTPGGEGSQARGEGSSQGQVSGGEKSGSESSSSQAQSQGAQAGDSVTGSQASNSGQQASGQQSDQKQQGGEASRSRGAERSQSAEKPGEKGKESPLQNIKRFREAEKELAAQYEDRPKQYRDEAAQKQPDAGGQTQVPQMTPVFSPLVAVFRWVFFAIVIAMVLLAVWWYWRDVLRALQNLLAELAAWWRSLWGGQRTVESEDVTIDVHIPPPPFASFADPFANGAASGMSIEQLVTYSFEAFEAWAREHGCPREADQTPYELAREVTRLNAAIATEARALADLYSRAAFAKGRLPSSAEEHLRALWRKMTRGVSVLS
jgi:hypothetical protein